MGAQQDNAHQAPNTLCEFAKCDNPDPQPVSLTGPAWASIWLEPGDSQDPFFRVDYLKFQQAESQDQPLSTLFLSFNAFSTGSYLNAVTLDPADLEEKHIGMREEHYPVQVKVKAYLDGNDYDSPVQGLSDLNEMRSEFEVSGLDSSMVSEPMVLKQPFDLWPVYLIAKTRFYGKVEPYTLNLTPYVYGDEESDQFQVKPRTFMIRASDGFATHYYPVNAGQQSISGQFLPFPNNNEAGPFEIPGPGWYVAEGNTLRTATPVEIQQAIDGSAEQPECDEGKRRCRPESQVVEFCVQGVWTEQVDCALSNQSCLLGACMDETPPEPDCVEGERRCRSSVVEVCVQGLWQEDVDCAASSQVCEEGACVNIDPCNGTCSDTEVCVQAQCLPKSGQVQYQCYQAPTKVCDPGQDWDCADGHVCVQGLCRKRTCQAQYQCHIAPDKPCDNDDNSDCAEGNVCVQGLCRKLSCQAQYQCHIAPDRPCDNDDNADCADDNVCAQGFCRKLSCQAQYQCYQTPDRPCDNDDSDCFDNHTCIDEVCHKNACL